LSSPDANYSNIAVSIENQAGFDIHLALAYSRVEITDPKSKHISYIIKLGQLRLPPPNFLTSATLAPRQSVNGVVYLVRSRDSGTMSPWFAPEISHPYEQKRNPPCA